MLESQVHADNCFVTLTYDDEHLPRPHRPGHWMPSLSPYHVTNFIKRLRRHYEIPIRYFLAGEYGNDSQRPHYHLALFGLSPLQFKLHKKWKPVNPPTDRDWETT